MPGDVGKTQGLENRGADAERSSRVKKRFPVECDAVVGGFKQGTARAQ